MLSLIQHEVVERNQWITNNELADIIAISQMTPGPIAINSATYIGFVATGTVWGSLLATIAVCTPAMTVMLILTRFYLKLQGNRTLACTIDGMKPMMIGMIGASALLLLTPATFIDWISWAIFGACFIASILKVNPILLIVLSGVAGLIIYL